MNIQPLKTNACPSHPSQPKEFVCLTCKKIYCHTCYQADKPHRTNTRGISEQLLDSFEFQQYLGSGTYGCVFKVLSLGEDHPYALKVIQNVTTQEDFEVLSKEASYTLRCPIRISSNLITAFALKMRSFS